MENKEFQFKTTLDCGGCVSKVKSDLDNTEGISQWNVDTANADKILAPRLFYLHQLLGLPASKCSF